ncbi:2-amino-4-hydroxy-6-hydroxymethyldihydropteridine diphosphokinase [Yoonia sp. F2084L]|uniref:2-amino-4-hydroxy-6- hydroxymethyldihydropteridine diphosphokinase n=1 Tax=Yoonia sp. F2084L TaxID=2926419 RepID=UPI001FF3B89E|nr:2-amino-4-hydroxy-6-hydroxymethyldihydropteridine diphosphokinase [Yoonia sp. F2084L]MCK0096890.1 2-amino-4-hydroxy-6-hydroxymethyldihydropteridine diphosphokinase [Yoonia sp. F2084L]
MSIVSRLALIALGSNEESVWGDARETVQKSMLAVGQLSEQSAKFSGLFTTPAFPAGAGPDFVNAAMAIFTKLSPADLLDQLHRIEADAGRIRTRRWGQRTLDIDLIAIADDVQPDAATHAYWRDLSLDDQQAMMPTELILPHPRLQDRAFVLIPLMDVAPDWDHPLLDLSVAQMCAALPSAAQADVVRLDGANTP